jgi:alpha-tubulin suppressor-like RCC1 family protein
MEEECKIKKGRINLPRGRVMHKVATGHNHCLLLAQHTGVRGSSNNPLNLYTIGENTHGQLGLGKKEHSPQFWKEVTKYGRQKIMDITANSTCSFALADANMFFAFGTFANIDSSRPVTVSIDQIAFKAVLANDGYYLGVETPDYHDDILWMVSEDDDLKKIGMPDSRVLVKVTKMVVGPTHSLVLVEAAEGVAASASASASATAQSEDDDEEPPAAKKLKMTPYEQEDQDDGKSFAKKSKVSVSTVASDDDSD